MRSDTVRCPSPGTCPQRKPLPLPPKVLSGGLKDCCPLQEPNTLWLASMPQQHVNPRYTISLNARTYPVPVGQGSTPQLPPFVALCCDGLSTTPKVPRTMSPANVRSDVGCKMKRLHCLFRLASFTRTASWPRWGTRFDVSDGKPFKLPAALCQTSRCKSAELRCLRLLHRGFCFCFWCLVLRSSTLEGFFR